MQGKLPAQAPPESAFAKFALTASAASAPQGRGARTAARLVEATLRCLARDGYSRLSVESIVAEAGVSRGALFHHFETKQELVADAMAIFLDRYMEQSTARDRSIGGDDSEMPASAMALVETFRKEAEVILEIAVALRTDEELRAKVTCTRSRADRGAMGLSPFHKRSANVDAIRRTNAFTAVICGARACEIINAGRGGPLNVEPADFGTGCS